MHKRGIIQKVGDNLFYLKKSANVSFEKIALATDISLSHVRNACSGEANITIAYLEKFAAFFGVAEADLVSETKNFPSKESLQKNIQKYLLDKGFSTTFNFKELGPTILVENYLLNSSAKQPVYAFQIKEAINIQHQTKYKTNDISRVLNNLSEQGMLTKTDTGNPKKPKYHLN
ncbi:helix-turn-helix transcriptional regulator [Pedobacter gandavensis]|uniref:helix-turn-helix domain-containing protein n=1 Tax=Pedobacter TaxID=84567 RepID=UPI001C98F1CD|nr:MULTISPECIES: helix-turn-helix transcriptional regulator [Pedobacter]WGQ09034.1 helix-turn-helix transcriptional regulator [Pedobacter gandavensis]